MFKRMFVKGGKGSDSSSPTGGDAAPQSPNASALKAIVDRSSHRPQSVAITHSPVGTASGAPTPKASPRRETLYVPQLADSACAFLSLCVHRQDTESLAAARMQAWQTKRMLDSVKRRLADWAQRQVDVLPQSAMRELQVRCDLGGWPKPALTSVPRRPSSSKSRAQQLRLSRSTLHPRHLTKMIQVCHVPARPVLPLRAKVVPGVHLRHLRRHRHQMTPPATRRPVSLSER